MATGTFGFRAGPAAAIKVEGLSKVQRDLRKLSTDGLDLSKTEFLETNKRVAEIIIGESKKYVPVLSGALAANIRNASTKESGESQSRKRRRPIRRTYTFRMAVASDTT
jgi:flagellar basal body rod protein FlgF